MVGETAKDDGDSGVVKIPTRRQALLGLGALALLSACKTEETPPPKLPEAPDPQPDDPEPAEPTCHSVKEGCKADSGTLVPIPQSGHVFRPPKAWVYAELEEASVTQAGDQGAVLVLTSLAVDAKDADHRKKRGDLVMSLAELVAVEPKAPVQLYKPDLTRQVNMLSMSLWERGGAKRSGDAGALLIFSTPIGDREIFGIAFAPSSDVAGTEAITTTLGTIEKDPAESKDGT